MGLATAGGFASDAQAGSETLELDVSDDAALVQVRKFPERLGRVGASRRAAGGRGPLGVGYCRGEGRANRLLGPAPALTPGAPRGEGVGASGNGDAAHHPAQEDHCGDGSARPVVIRSCTGRRT